MLSKQDRDPLMEIAQLKRTIEGMYQEIDEGIDIVPAYLMTS